MARPKEFDREAALGAAMELFWTYGYKATSMSDLQRVMGIGRQSLYDTFGGKREVFKEALDRYLDEGARYWGDLLADDDGFEAIRTYLLTIGRDQTQTTPRRACMMFNTYSEVAPHDPEIKTQVRKGVLALQKKIELALGRAREQGTLSSNMDLRSVAIFLTTQVGGMNLMSRGGATRKELRAAAEVTLRVIQ